MIRSISTRIAGQYRRQLAGLRQELFWATGPDGQHDHGQRLSPIGPVASVTNANTNLTIAADVAAMGWGGVGLGLQGTCVTFALAGHSRHSGIRAVVPLDECDAWIEVILGGALSAHAYRFESFRAGVTRQNVISFRLFLDALNNPLPRPAGLCDGTYQILATP